MHNFIAIIFMLKIDYFLYIYIFGNIYLKIWKDYDMYNDNFFE